MSYKSILDKYPDKVPVMITRAHSSKKLPDIDKHKFLIPRDMTFGHVLAVIRKRLKLENSSTAIFVSINNKVVPAASLRLDAAYREHRGDDDVLHLQYYGENTFGSSGHFRASLRPLSKYMENEWFLPPTWPERYMYTKGAPKNPLILLPFWGREIVKKKK